VPELLCAAGPLVCYWYRLVNSSFLLLFVWHNVAFNNVAVKLMQLVCCCGG
jgi:hypothetical protein